MCQNDIFYKTVATDALRAFAQGILNGICRKILPFLHKNQASSKLLKINYYKINK